MPESPAALIIEGEAGIGKTTRWLAAINQAREQGLTVLAARAGQAESVLAYAALADGDPFYALELARAMESSPLGGAKSLPATLADGAWAVWTPRIPLTPDSASYPQAHRTGAGSVGNRA